MVAVSMGLFSSVPAAVAVCMLIEVTIADSGWE